MFKIVNLKINLLFQTAKSKNKRLELRFRPDDGYCKPTCGDRHQTAGFLLRVRIKKSRREKIEKAEELNKNVEPQVAKENHSSHKDENHCTNDVEDESVHKLTNQIINCSGTSTESNSNNDASSKNVPPTFDRHKYENLSEDAAYQLPKLKVLGRVESEFRFTSRLKLFLLL